MNKIKTCLKYAVMGLVCTLSFVKPADARADAESYWYDYIDTDYEVVVAAPDGYVNFRYGPDTTYDIITRIPNGTFLMIEALGDEKRDHDFHWGQTEYNGTYGWVALSQVEPTGKYADKAGEFEEPVEEEETSKAADFSSQADKVIAKSGADKDKADEEAAQSSSEASEEDEDSEEAGTSEEAGSSDEEVSEETENDQDDDGSDTGLAFKHKVIIIALIVAIVAVGALAVLTFLMLKKK